MAKKAKKTGKPAKKAAVHPIAAIQNAKLGGQHPDKRLPCWEDGYEILCKWNAAANEYHCDKVPIGGDWRPT
jgi:hypothetical protein